MGRRLNGKSQKPNKKVIDNIPNQKVNMTDQSTESALDLGHQKRKHVLMHTKVFTDTSRSSRKKHKSNESKSEDKEGSSNHLLKDCVRNISKLRVQDSNALNFRSQRKASSHPTPETEEGSLSDVASQSFDKGDDRWSNFCLTCHEPGTLLCCEGEGCSKTYHLKCLDPPLQEVPSGVWLCPTCLDSASRSITARDDLVVLNRTSAQPDGENQGMCSALMDEVENIIKEQRDLHTCLQIHLLKLCQAAGLPEYVNTMAEDLLAYAMYKFKIDTEPAVVLQATILSLVWRAASLFKLWLDPQDLVTLAYNVLQYECDVNLVNSLYSSFKILRTEFQGLADFIPIEFSNKFLKVPKLEIVAYPEAAHCYEVVGTTACQNLRWDTQLQLQGFYTNAPGTSADSESEGKEGSSDCFLKDCVRNISELRVQDSKALNFRSQRKASSHPTPKTEEGSLSDFASQYSDKGDGHWSNFCLTCHEPGTLLCCEGEGCSKSYHLKCLNPQLLELPSGVWLCPTCVNSASRSITSRDDLVVFNRTSAQPDGENQGVCDALMDEVENIAKEQRDLHTCLQIHLLKLCQAAGLPEYVNPMAEDLLAYVMYKFKIDTEPAVVLQATILSLVWRAASLFKLWLDPQDLVTLAYNVLQYECDVNLVNSLYSSFKILRTEFQGLADFIPVEFSNKFLKVPKLEVVAYPEAEHCDEVVGTTACQNLRWDTQLQLQGFYTNAPGTSADACIKGVHIKEEQNYMTSSSQEPSAADPSLLELNRIKQHSECLVNLNEMKMFNYQKEIVQELAEVKRSLEEAYKKKDLRYQSKKQHLDEIEKEIFQILASQGGSNKFY